MDHKLAVVDFQQPRTDMQLLVLREALAYDCVAVIMIAWLKEVIAWPKEMTQREVKYRCQ